MSYTAPSPSPSASSNSESDSTLSSSSSHLSSPSLLSTEAGLNLDASDPLNLLLKSATQFEGSEVTPDWSELSSLWNGADQLSQGMKYPYPELTEFSSNMSIDPSTLQFDPSASLNNFVPEDSYHLMYNDPQLSYPFPSDVLSAFTFQPPTDSLGVLQQRRLSVTSSSSSSGASLSPILEHPAPAPTTSEPEASSSASTSVADELAQLVRKSAGVMHAVPVGSHIGGHGVSLTVPIPQPQAKVPIPRLSRPATATSTPTSSAASSPPPSTPPSNDGQHAVQQPSAAQLAIGTSGRPKTSHTTIERRYRTNLNARIQSLRMAVPALRVLDRKNGKNSRKESLAGERQENKAPEQEDVIDERGFVDGVRVARKCSKANVLGKAVEYIRVLKKRENRLRNEQAGLKSLISGLVGGPALLREWEREWVAKFGGPEKDELLESELVVRVTNRDNANKQGGDGDGSDGEEDDDEDGDEDGSDDEGGGRKRKKVKTSASGGKSGFGKEREKGMGNTVKIQPTPQVGVISGIQGMPTAVTGVPVVPEKRKRGRPRKNPLPPPVAPPTSAMAAPHSAMQSMPVVAVPVTVPHTSNSVAKMEDVVMDDASKSQEGHAQQYLLASFALFSFFNSPITSSSFYSSSSSHSTHPHTGHVLNPLPNTPPHGDAAYPTDMQGEWGWQETIQMFHLIISALVFASIVMPWVPFKPHGLMKKLTLTLHKVGLSSSPYTGAQPKVASMTLAEALAQARRGAANEAEGLRNALDAGKTSPTFRLWKMKSGTEAGRGFERKGLEQRAWVRLGELAVLGGPSQTTLYSRLQIYVHMRAHISWFSASPSDLITLALLAHEVPIIGQRKARVLWESAREKAGLCAGVPEERKREIALSGLVNEGNRAVREYEKLVLRDLDVREAVSRLRALSLESKRERYMLTPLGALAGTLVKERTKKHLMMQFISTVVPPASSAGASRSGGLFTGPMGNQLDLWDEDTEVAEKRKTIDAARSLGGSIAELGDILERVHVPGDPQALEYLSIAKSNDHEEQSGIDSEIRALLDAILLYRKIFPSSILGHSRVGSGCDGMSTQSSSAASCGVSILLSPPPSPSQKDIRIVYALRRALGNAVFDCDCNEGGKAEGLVDCADESINGGIGGNGLKEDNVIAWALEDARDRVVDMLVDWEMEGNGRVRS